jgi:hypothetical protein
MKLFVALPLLCASCWAPTSPPGLSHFDPTVWGNACVAQLYAPDQLAIEAGLLATTIALIPYDRQISDDLNEDTPITEGSTKNGDGVAVGLTVIAAGLGAGKWIDGDAGRSAEVLVQSFALTEGFTELLKHTTRRNRPEGGGHDSFPSGHTSYSFAMATYLQRTISDDDPGGVGWLGYFAYAPAAYVGIDRLEAKRHWPTDVAFGAFLGVLMTNITYDAHYGTARSAGLFGVRGLALEPGTPEEHADLALVLHF